MKTVHITGDYIDYRAHKLTQAQYNYWSEQDPVFLEEHLYSDQIGSRSEIASNNFGGNIENVCNLYKSKNLIYNKNFKFILDDGSTFSSKKINSNLIKTINSNFYIEVDIRGTALIVISIPTNDQEIDFDKFKINYVLKDDIKIIDTIEYEGRVLERGIAKIDINKKNINLRNL